MSRTVAIGKQDFGDVIAKNYFYVDKTDFIKEWWENGDDVTLITRPRRFGKTLTMSMLNYFFSINHAGRSDLFEDLNIWKHEEYRELQGTYPVILLSFAGVKGSNFENLKRGIREEISCVFSQFRFLVKSNLLEASDKEFFNNVLSSKIDDFDASVSLKKLSCYLYEHYNKKVLILLDEYDTPMQEAYTNGCWNELTGFMRELFNSAFKTNPYLERGLMTGITRVSKESMFSDLNNIEVITTTSKKYATVFGFTEQEVLQALEEYSLSDKKQEVREWYDGFRFGDCSSIYNPWSIINFLDKREFAAYWANTSSNALVGQLIREGSDDVKKAMEDLLQGETFTTLLDEEIIFKSLNTKKSAIWSLLLASGYIKIVDVQQNILGKTEYAISLTNNESILVFSEIFTEWFSSDTLEFNQFSLALLDGNKKYMMDYLNAFLQKTASFFDTGNGVSNRAEPERFYHGLVLGLIAGLSELYRVTSNRESGFGRYDVLLEPKKEGFDGIILEFKVIDTGTEKMLEDTIHSAIQQILDKKYAATLEQKCDRDKIRIYGFAFKGKEVLVDGGLLTEYEALGSPAESASKVIAF